MSGAGIEELYKNYGILADAGDSVSQVSFLACYMTVVRFWGKVKPLYERDTSFNQDTYAWS